MADRNKEDDYEFETGPLSDFELKRVRRILQEDHYARKLRAVIRVWLTTLGIVATFVAGLLTIYKEAERFFK